MSERDERGKLTVEVVNLRNGAKLAIDREDGGRVTLELSEVSQLLQDLVSETVNAVTALLDVDLPQEALP
jgi:hypothetical protein